MGRHDILDAMNEFKLDGMRASGACPRAGADGSGDEIASKGPIRRDEFYLFVANLIRAERKNRQVGSISYRIGGARFSVLKVACSPGKSPL